MPRRVARGQRILLSNPLQLPLYKLARVNDMTVGKEERWDRQLRRFSHVAGETDSLSIYAIPEDGDCAIARPLELGIPCAVFFCRPEERDPVYWLTRSGGGDRGPTVARSLGPVSYQDSRKVVGVTPKREWRRVG